MTDYDDSYPDLFDGPLVMGALLDSPLTRALVDYVNLTLQGSVGVERHPDLTAPPSRFALNQPKWVYTLRVQRPTGIWSVDDRLRWAFVCSAAGYGQVNLGDLMSRERTRPGPLAALGKVIVALVEGSTDFR